MKIKEKIRQKVSQSLDVLIPENQWEKYIDLLDRDGKFSKKTIIAVILLLCQQVEKLETLVEDLYFELDMLGGVKHEEKSEVKDFKLRTPMDIAKELDKQYTRDTKAFYLSPADFKIFEKTIDPTLAKTDPTRGYSKEKDPLDGKEKTCLLYKDLPVFRSS